MRKSNVSEMILRTLLVIHSENKAIMACLMAKGKTDKDYEVIRQRLNEEWDRELASVFGEGNEKK